MGGVVVGRVLIVQVWVSVFHVSDHQHMAVLRRLRPLHLSLQRRYHDHTVRHASLEPIDFC